MENWPHIKKHDVLSLEEEESLADGAESDSRQAASLPRRHYPINLEGYDDSAYFTYREAQCMAQIMRGKTIKASAQAIGLSPRTVEYYLKNMKAKFKCRTKSELMQLISLSDFMHLIHDLK